MARRKEKDKHKEQYSQQMPRILPASMSQKSIKNEPSTSSFPKLEPSTIVPSPGLSPIPIDNRFSPLGSTLSQMRPNYQSALTSTYDPLALPSTATPLSSSTFRPRSSPYISKSSANLFIIEPHVSTSISPATLASNHFPPGFHYMPHNYVASFYYIFLHQTPEFSHSWFINFDNKFHYSELPYWFLHWWDTHGPKSEIIPLQITELITTFSSKVKLPERNLFFPMPLLFFTRYKIPWIMKWSYNINWETRIFSRQFSVKWWDRFEIHRIAEYFYRDFPKPVHAPEPKPSSSHSSQSNLSVEGKSKSELQDMAKQLLLQASQMHDDDEDNESQSSSSCQPRQQSPSPSPDRPMRWSDYPHSQDPNEAYIEAYAAYDLNSD
ncbi:unnamed protein product [Prunus armeniaca]